MRSGGKIELYHMDNMDLMAQYPDSHFELAIVDPPYGIAEDGHRENNRSKLAVSKNYHKALWDQDRPSKEYFNELRRVSKNQIVWGGNHLIDLIGMYSPCWLVWDKDNSGNFADCELAYTSFTTAVRKFKFRWNGMLQENMRNKEIRIHPTQKPVALYQWILKNYAKEGDKILDTHLGSGSIAIACHKMKFDLVACEIDQEYYQAAVKRLEDETAQMVLF
jgi:site-specific DNA-methyltransferase (adenine-specific)